ncbi:MAG TPA: hypothetical protein VF055_11005 [Steroidobacteraceae bacterium]
MKIIPGSKYLIRALALGFLLAPVAFAEPPADKGKAAAPAHDDDKSGNKDRHDDDDDNRGQVVSDCNHRANGKDLKGKERQQYVEWCTEHGERYKYDDRRYDQDRSCYRRADERGMSGDFRRVFIQDCLRKLEKNR